MSSQYHCHSLCKLKGKKTAIYTFCFILKAGITLIEQQVFQG
ncbi:hypothetical protein AM1_C0168 (plasmid) [Acaryochloris marina MBIC11017]|uniref:Uncharacterized protein n=1 Tax=Acaryochloris marina (strain MBIC 11017) TaxID=329726 RepID=A8ZMR0_ACAM1|nr:hypothetical protein AM1_C0168 [Acaryochloris marina MBIC11017]